MSEESTSKDPLAALGSAVFFHICEHLPFRSLTRLPVVCRSWRDYSASNKSGIWRSACRRHGLEVGRIAVLREREGESEDSAVDWEKECREHVMPDVNWSNGRCESKFVNIGGQGSVVNSYTVDEEQQTCILTYQYGGLEVLALESGRTLFSMPRVAKNMRVECCKGLVLIETQSYDISFRVFRTQPAIDRSDQPWSVWKSTGWSEAEDAELPQQAEESTSLLDPSWRPQSAIRPVPTDPVQAIPERPARIPRGCLALYREIIVQKMKRTSEYRVGLDRQGKPDERAILVAAGFDGVSIWDIGDAEESPETFPYPEGITKPLSVNSNDDFIFLCGLTQLDIISRSTHQTVHSFPCYPLSAEIPCALTYFVDLNYKAPPKTIDLSGDDSDDDVAVAPPTTNTVLGQLRDVRGCRGRDPGYAAVLAQGVGPEAKQPVRVQEYPKRHYGLFACGSTETDLIYSNISGQLFITRDFAAVLAIADSDERERRWSEQTLVFGFVEPISEISVHGTHVGLGTSTNKNVLFFDTRTLPTLPLTPAKVTSRQAKGPFNPDVPSIRLHAVLPIDTRKEEKLGDVQVHSKDLYSTYLAYSSNLGGVSRCVRRLDFGLGEIAGDQSNV